MWLDVLRASIPDFIAKVAEGDGGRYQIITQQSFLPAVCGRVCPRRPSASRSAGHKEPVKWPPERFVADWHNKNVCEAPRKPAPNGPLVAVIGSGPQATCAGDLQE
ncbi:MAG: hypothetical protein ACLRSY_01830 [Acutalibacter sp.]